MPKVVVKSLNDWKFVPPVATAELMVYVPESEACKVCVSYLRITMTVILPDVEMQPAKHGLVIRRNLINRK